MAYARFAEGDVYLYVGLEIQCLGCRLTPEGNWYGSQTFPDLTAALAHLREHKAAGHKVPRRAFRQIEADIARVAPRSRPHPSSRAPRRRDESN